MTDQTNPLDTLSVAIDYAQYVAEATEHKRQIIASSLPHLRHMAGADEAYSIVHRLERAMFDFAHGVHTAEAALSPATREEIKRRLSTKAAA